MDGGWMKYKLKVEKFSEERGGEPGGFRKRNGDII